MRLRDGAPWSIPITLDVPEATAKGLGPGARLALRDPEGVMLAALQVDEVWQPDKKAEAEAVYGTTSRDHPGVAHLLERTHPFHVGGRLEGLQLPATTITVAAGHPPSSARSRQSGGGWWWLPDATRESAPTSDLRAAKEGSPICHTPWGDDQAGDLDIIPRALYKDLIATTRPRP